MTAIFSDRWLGQLATLTTLMFCACDPVPAIAQASDDAIVDLELRAMFELSPDLAPILDRQSVFDATTIALESDQALSPREFSHLLTLRGEASLGSGQYQSALEDFDAASRHHPPAVRPRVGALLCGRRMGETGSIDDLERLASETTSEPAASAYAISQLAFELYAAGDRPAAEVQAIRALALDPGECLAHLLLSSIACEQSDWQVAINHADAVLRLNPGLSLDASLDPFTIRADALLGLGRNQEAMQSLEMSMLTYPDSASIMRHKWRICNESRAFVASLQLALALHVRYSDDSTRDLLRESIARAGCTMSVDDNTLRATAENLLAVQLDVSNAALMTSADVISCATKALASDGISQDQTRVLRRIRGEAFLRRNEYVRAELDLRDQADLSKPDDYVNILHAEALLGSGKINEGIAEIDAVLARNSESAHCHALLSAVAAKRGSHSRALELATRAIELDPAFPWSYSHRSKLLYDDGRLEQALEDIDTALLRTAMPLIDRLKFLFPLRVGVMNKLGRHRTAILTLLFLERIDGPNVDNQLQIWSRCQSLKKPHLAMFYLMKIKADYPDHPDVKRAEAISIKRLSGQ